MEKQRMTRQEALKELENLTIDYGKRTAEEIERLDEAVDMAIAALREDAVDRPTCDDAVSRQQAVDALIEQMPSPFTADGSHPADEGIFRVQETYADCIETIKLLPSVQPDFDITVKIDKAYDDGYKTGYLQGRHDWGDLDE